GAGLVGAPLGEEASGPLSRVRPHVSSPPTGGGPGGARRRRRHHGRDPGGGGAPVPAGRGSGHGYHLDEGRNWASRPGCPSRRTTPGVTSVRSARDNCHFKGC